MITSSSHATGWKVTRAAALAVLATALAACGGGGADSPSPTGSFVTAPAPPPPGTGNPAAGAVLRAQDAATGAQTLRAIGAIADGGYALAWTDEQPGQASALRLRRFDAQGRPLGDAQQVPVADASPATTALAVLADGGLELAFARVAPASDAEPWIVRSAVVVQRYDPVAQRLGPERELAAVVQNRIGAASMRYVAEPSLVRWDNGRFLAGWSLVEEDASGRTPQIWTQRFDAAGQPVDGPVLAGRGEPGSSYRLQAAPGGGHILTTFGRVMGRTYLRYTAWDGAVAPALPAGALGVEEGSVLLPLQGGRSVLVSPAGPGASVQPYAPDGQAIGPATSLQRMPVALAALRGGGWLALSAGDGGPLQAQRFDLDGLRAGRAFNAAQRDAVPQVAPLAGGGLALAWTDGSAAVLMQVLSR